MDFVLIALTVEFNFTVPCTENAEYCSCFLSINPSLGYSFDVNNCNTLRSVRYESCTESFRLYYEPF